LIDLSFEFDFLLRNEFSCSFSFVLKRNAKDGPYKRELKKGQTDTEKSRKPETFG